MENERESIVLWKRKTLVKAYKKVIFIRTFFVGQLWTVKFARGKNLVAKLNDNETTTTKNPI